MSDYHLVKIGTVYLTNDGLETGRHCRTTITGLDALIIGYTGVIHRAIDNTPYAQVTNNIGVGQDIQILIYRLTAAVYASLQTVINGAFSAAETINVVIDGDGGTFDLECMPGLPKPLTWAGDMGLGRLHEVGVNLTVAEINEE
jgi:hypothetical protein